MKSFIIAILLLLSVNTVIKAQEKIPKEPKIKSPTSENTK